MINLNHILLLTPRLKGFQMIQSLLVQLLDWSFRLCYQNNLSPLKFLHFLNIFAQFI